MKKNVTDFVVGEFKDYKGLTHKVVIAAVSETLYYKEGDENYESDQYEVSHYDENAGTEYINGPLRKSLRIGATVCNPTDDFNEEVGIKKAVGRALGSEPVLYSTKPGIINTLMVKALLKQELEYCCANPELLIPGYRDSEKRYLYNKEMIEKIDKLSEAEKRAYDFLVSNSKKTVDQIKELVQFTLNRKL